MKRSRRSIRFRRLELKIICKILDFSILYIQCSELNYITLWGIKKDIIFVIFKNISITDNTSSLINIIPIKHLKNIYTHKLNWYKYLRIYDCIHINHVLTSQAHIHINHVEKTHFINRFSKYLKYLYGISVVIDYNSRYETKVFMYRNKFIVRTKSYEWFYEPNFIKNILNEVGDNMSYKKQVYVKTYNEDFLNLITNHFALYIFELCS